MSILDTHRKYLQYTKCIIKKSKTVFSITMTIQRKKKKIIYNINSQHKNNEKKNNLKKNNNIIGDACGFCNNIRISLI